MIAQGKIDMIDIIMSFKYFKVYFLSCSVFHLHIVKQCEVRKRPLDTHTVSFLHTSKYYITLCMHDAFVWRWAGRKTKFKEEGTRGKNKEKNYIFRWAGRKTTFKEEGAAHQGTSDASCKAWWHASIWWRARRSFQSIQNSFSGVQSKAIAWHQRCSNLVMKRKKHHRQPGWRLNLNRMMMMMKV